MKMLMGLLMTVVFLSACAPPVRLEANWESYNSVIDQQNRITVSSDFDRTWMAVEKIAAELKMKIITADRTSGLLMCSKPQAPWKNTTLEMSILLRPQAPNRTDVWLQSVILAVPINPYMKLQVYPSTGETEKEFLDRLGKVLTVLPTG